MLMQPQGPEIPTIPPVPEQPLAPQQGLPQQAPVTDTSEAGWNFEPGATSEQSFAPLQPATVSWTASEYIAHTKSTAWFAALGLGLVILSVITYLLTRDFIPVAAITVAIISFGFFAGHTPRVLEYVIDDRGIHIGPKTYPYSDFKSFDLTEEGSLPSLQLMPLKRFMPPITLFYEDAQEDEILDTIALYLPHQEQVPGIIEHVTKRMRF